jgi:hypothetical protein
VPKPLQRSSWGDSRPAKPCVIGIGHHGLEIAVGNSVVGLEVADAPEAVAKAVRLEEDLGELLASADGPQARATCAAPGTPPGGDTPSVNAT